MQIEFRNRQFTIRYVQPYLHIRAHGVLRICVPLFPELLTHVLHSNQNHATASDRGQEKAFAGSQQTLLLARNAPVHYCLCLVMLSLSSVKVP